ncbi:MAG: hypothetical protein K9L95_01250 [Candidatus Omnitrophica bacterium]|nr:hypothetical protein [Candidatus Omnitrophota bacterium]MCF7877212.1 hypothetical protein [Candidatus Omnitrophota bacterium]MCF7878081.1 hypothetical protein [Candidatus Omnitrophota bacterium]MCF7893016.1 hypothetical protein [Candidatus Omnitrophota bacterium]
MMPFKENSSLTTLVKRIDSFRQGYRQNIAILADDENEISDLLDNYLSEKKVNQLTHIYLNPAYLDKFNLLKSVSFSLLSEYSSTTTNLDQLITICSGLLPETTGLIKALLQKNIDFPEILDLINQFIKESAQSCVFIIENFPQVNKLFNNFYQQLANFAISQRKCMLIISSPCPNTANKILGNELNLLFGNFEKVYLNKNNFFSNFLWLESKLHSVSPSPDFISFFINIIGNNKCYYQLFQKSIKKFYNEVEENAIVKILENLLFKKETYFFQKFNNRIDKVKYHFKEPLSTVKLLLLLAKGYMRKESLRELSGASSRDINHKLNKLTALNYLNKHGNIYKIKDRLFSFWLAHFFKFYSIFPVFDPEKRKNLWQKEMQEEINVFKEEFVKNRLEKILELFKTFEDDALSIDKDKLILPKLDNVKTISYPESGFHLLIGEGKKIVFAGIKERIADDNDLLEFIKKGSNIKGKNVQKIFISLDRLTDTANLLAKNKKVTLWDRNKVNYLLDIYNKPNFLQYL